MIILTQLNVLLPNAPGSLAKLGDILRAANVNITAISCTEGTNKTLVHLVVDDPDTARIILKSQWEVTTNPVLSFILGNKPGAIASLGRACTVAGINIKNIYSTSCGREAMVILAVEDVTKAQEFFKNHNNNHNHRKA